MAFIVIGYGARGQFERTLVNDLDQYRFARFHVGQELDEIVERLLAEAQDLGNPPILADVTCPEPARLVRALQIRGYPRLVRAAA
jgi:hypothetical protein